MEDHIKLIEDLGGQTKLQRALGLDDRRQVDNWRRQGIPWKWRNTIAKIAWQADVSLPEGFLDPLHESNPD